MAIADIRSAVETAIERIAPDADVRRIRPDRPLREQIDLDSMDWLNVVDALRDALSIEIPESDYGRLVTIDDIVGYLASRTAEPRVTPSAATAAVPSLPRATHWIGGTPVTVRPMCPDDMPLEADFVRRLSTEARYKRFMVTMSELPAKKLEYLSKVDQVRHVALVAAADCDGRQSLAGVARYIVDDAGTACELAIAIGDAWHGSGLAGILMHALMDIAHARGLTSMQGSVLATNVPMRRFARQLGFTEQRDPGSYDTVRIVRAL